MSDFESARAARCLATNRYRNYCATGPPARIREDCASSLPHRRSPMIKGIKFASIPATDQDRALRFWTEQVGFLVKTDQPFQDGQRWIELRIKGSDAGVVLFTADAHKAMIGAFSNISFYSDNVEKTY